MKKMFALSTTTLGGAVIMLLVSALLGDRAPWFVEKLYASTKHIYSVSLDVDGIFSTGTLPADIDESRFYVDTQRRFYIQLPPADWALETADPGDLLTGLSAADVPIVRAGHSAFSAMTGSPQLQKGDLTSTTISPPAASHTISFTENTVYDGIAFALNPFEDPEFVKASMRGAVSLLGIDREELEALLAGETEEARAEFEAICDQMRAQGEMAIASNWPEDKQIQTGVAVTTFRPHLLSSNPIATALRQGGRTSLWSSLLFLQLLNPELASFNVRQLDISKDNKVLLFDASARLQHVQVDGLEVDELELVKLFLIVAENDLTYVVSLSYIYGDQGTSRQVARQAEAIFQAFRVIV